VQSLACARLAAPDRPILLVDVDGVLSLFDFPPSDPPAGIWATVEGMPHRLSAAGGERLQRLSEMFELVWCTGWEEKADRELPRLIGAPRGLPHLHFPHGPERTTLGHWKLEAIDAHAGRDRPLAWVDDALNAACDAWAAARPGPTLLISTEPAVGLTAGHVAELERWAARLRERAARA
jgi:hypothetical protein